MATIVGNEKDPITLLNDLIELDFDAIEAYKAAIRRIDNTADRSQLSTFLEDHRRHVTDLSAIVRELGGAPATGADMKQILTRGKVVLGSLMGDKAILQAMKSNEDDTNAAYQRAASRVDLSAAVLVVLERNLGDERRHRAWILERLNAIEGVQRARF